MRICIIGAGVIGVTTAYELAADGHEVTVLERRDGVAGELSFANGGLAAPGLGCGDGPGLEVGPGAAGLTAARLRDLLRRGAPARLHLPPGPRQVGWLRQWRRERRSGQWVQRQRALHELAEASRRRFDALCEALRLKFEHGDGALVLLRGQAEVDAVDARRNELESLGIRHALLDEAACRRIEPGLASETPLAGGVHLPDARVGNCRQFVQALKIALQAAGVRFEFSRRVIGLQAGAQPMVTTVATGDAALARHRNGAETRTDTFDAVVVCAALGAPALLRPLGLRLPLMPVWGYTITAPLRHFEGHPDVGPRSAVVDARHGVAITRLGSRVRVSGRFEIGGSLDLVDDTALEPLHRVLQDWYPGVVNLTQVQRWKAPRPTLPDGVPLIGGTRAGGIWLNLAHGGSGWMLACGSARLIADGFSGAEPPFDTRAFAIERLA